MTTFGFRLFETPIGGCGIVWGERGVVAVQLPEAGEAAARARIRRDFLEAQESAAPPEVQRAIDGIVALLSGHAQDLSFVQLDMTEIAPFNQRVYEVARTIPPGATLSYGEIASRLGDPAAARDVGAALGQNPFSIVVPCHRVIAAGGRLGGYGGSEVLKRSLLVAEGVPVSGSRVRELDRVLWKGARKR